MMNRRTFIASAVTVLAPPVVAEAQPPAKVARIGYLAGGPGAPHFREAFLQGLRDLGYVEGRNLVIEYRDAEGKLERLPGLATELVALKVDVIFAGGGTPAARAAKQATATIPIVFPAISDPIGSGLVTAFARPGGNATGLTFFTPELVGKSLELLKQAVPGLIRVGALWTPGEFGASAARDMLTGAEVAARALGVQLQLVEARQPSDLDRAFSEMLKARAGALAVLPGGMLLLQRSRIVHLAARSRLPAVFPYREGVDAGGLMSHGPNVPDLYRRAATYVAKILKGTKPSDLPVEQPTKFELVINLKTAKALGLTIPPSLLQRADQVIDP
jgi:putative ABC transport system substrate-binding protein